MLGVDQQDAPDAAHDFIPEFSLTFPHLREAGKETARRWSVTGLRETFFVSREGNIVGHIIGVVSTSQLRRGNRGGARRQASGAQAGGDRQTID